MRLGILQCGHAPEPICSQTGDFDAMFRALLRGPDTEFQTWNAVDMEFPPGPDAADGWLITGSRHGVYEDHEFIAPLEQLIRAIHARKQPLIGICFGHQIIAKSLGGKVEKAATGWIVGHQTYDWQGRKIALNAWHQDQVITPPTDARILAFGPGSPHAALAIGNHVLTVQAHPEFDAQMIAGLIAHRSATVPPPLLDRARADLNTPTDSAHIADLIRATLNGAQA